MISTHYHDLVQIPPDKFRPDRIIIECSTLVGILVSSDHQLSLVAHNVRSSGYPATLIASQIRQLERDTGDFVLDAVVSVVDTESFVGYEDTSPTPKIQASSTSSRESVWRAKGVLKDARWLIQPWVDTN